jgi:two-component system, LytTR family, sensor kinase
VPALLLQPLVENAVRHGIAPLRQGGRLQLIGRLCGAGLCLSIIDDGGGASLRGVDESSGVGLSATRRQLHAYFGAGADLRVETSPGCGFAVHLSLPLMTPEMEAG